MHAIRNVVGGCHGVRVLFKLNPQVVVQLVVRSLRSASATPSPVVAIAVSLMTGQVGVHALKSVEGALHPDHEQSSIVPLQRHNVQT